MNRNLKTYKKSSFKANYSKKKNKKIFRKIFVIFFSFFTMIIAFLYFRYIILAMQHGGAITVSFNAHNEMYIEFWVMLTIFLFLSIGSIYLYRKF